MIKRIVVLSDCIDVAYNEVRAVILKELGSKEDKIVIEPLVKIEPFSIINGAFLLRLLAEVYPPKETLFLVILNPLKQRPARIMGETLNGIKFVGANTGVFGWLAQDFGIKKIYEIRDRGFIPFGGKFVHAPIAAKLAKGIDFKKLGKKKNNSFLFDYKIPNGTVVHIDNFGLIKIKGEKLNYSDGDQFFIYVNNKRKIKAEFNRRMMNLNDGQWVIYPGSSLGGMPELGKVRCTDGAKILSIKIGDIIKWSKAN